MELASLILTTSVNVIMFFVLGNTIITPSPHRGVAIFAVAIVLFLTSLLSLISFKQFKNMIDDNQDQN